MAQHASPGRRLEARRATGACCMRARSCAAVCCAATLPCQRAARSGAGAALTAGAHAVHGNVKRRVLQERQRGSRQPGGWECRLQCQGLLHHACQASMQMCSCALVSAVLG